MKVHSARLLNERTGWFGLSVFDLAIVGYCLIFSDSILRPFGLELVAFVISGVVFVFLLNVRLRSRPKTIRDFLRSKLTSAVVENGPSAALSKSRLHSDVLEVRLRGSEPSPSCIQPILNNRGELG